MFIENLMFSGRNQCLTRRKETQFFYYSFFLGRITGVNYSSAFSRIVCRWRNILCLVIHMKMNCAIIKAERIARWYVLIKLIVIWKEGKRWISDCWVIWRDGIFISGCSWRMVVKKMRHLFLLHLVSAISSI